MELWDCLGMKEHPRIIVALAPLGDEVSSPMFMRAVSGADGPEDGSMGRSPI